VPGTDFWTSFFICLMQLIPLAGFHEPFSAISHFLAALVTLWGGRLLMKKGHGNALRSGSLLLYITALLFLFIISGIYHSLTPGPWRSLFMRLDYASVWLVIAASATPMHIFLFRGLWRWGMIALYWTGALSCLILVDLYFTQLPFFVILSAYLGVGWLGLISLYKIVDAFGIRASGGFLLAGLAYSAGGIVDYLEAPVLLTGVIGPHEILHICVVLGATLHSLFLYKWADRRAPHAHALERALRVAWSEPERAAKNSAWRKQSKEGRRSCGNARVPQ